MLGFFKTFAPKPQGFVVNGEVAVSLTAYFDDTVRHIVRANVYNKMVQSHDVPEEMTKPDGVATLLLQSGQEVFRRAAINHDEIAPAQNLEEGVLTACDIGRQAYGLKLASVYYTPNEIKDKVKFVL